MNTWEADKAAVRRVLGVMIILASIPFVFIGVGLAGVYLGWKIYQSGRYLEEQEGE